MIWSQARRRSCSNALHAFVVAPQRHISSSAARSWHRPGATGGQSLVVPASPYGVEAVRTPQQPPTKRWKAPLVEQTREAVEIQGPASRARARPKWTLDYKQPSKNNSRKTWIRRMVQTHSPTHAYPMFCTPFPSPRSLLRLRDPIATHVKRSTC